MTKAKQPHIGIITPVFNKVEHTRKFLKTVKKQTYSNYRVYVIDDASTDNTNDIISKEFPEVVILRSEEGNLWWAGGTNLGVEHALKDAVDYVLFINNDVEMSPHYLQDIMTTAAEYPASLVGSMILDQQHPNNVWFMGGYMDANNGRMAHKTGAKKDYSKDLAADWLTGMGLLIPTDVFAKIGMLNQEKYPQYYGDTDFSLRAKEAGYGLVVSQNAKLSADVSSSWVSTWLRKPRVTFLYNLYFSRRSPFQLSKTVYFYHCNWNKSNYLVALLKLYTVGLKGVYIGYMRSFAKRILVAVRVLPS